ncbi:MAG: septum formation inhibitor Maf [Nitrospinae bacterium]|nr:septum formation inhibitor Maf [Nitrospinota bacterium]
MKQAGVILASASPRRRELLAAIGVSFRAVSAEVDETPRIGEDVSDLVRRLALEKARRVAGSEKESLVIGADTLVAVGGRILGKPSDAKEAAEMLYSLSGRSHDVLTGLAFVKSDELLEENCVTISKVTFKNLSAVTIEKYVATGEPLGKAGAYAIQGLGAGLIERHEGSFTNIVGLPVTELLGFLLRFGTERIKWEPLR